MWVKHVDCWVDMMGGIDAKQHQRALILIEVLELSVFDNVTQALGFMERMEHEWHPAARGLLGMHQHHYLSSIWKNIGQALEPAEFDPNHPNRHASRAYWEGHHWNQVKRSVVRVPDYTSQPALLIRLTDVDYRLHNRGKAIASWLLLCRVAPLMFRKMVEKKEISDQQLHRPWLLLQEQDMEPELTPEWFPAWMLMEEPGLAAVVEPGQRDDPPSCCI